MANEHKPLRSRLSAFPFHCKVIAEKSSILTPSFPHAPARFLPIVAKYYKCYLKPGNHRSPIIINFYCHVPISELMLSADGV